MSYIDKILIYGVKKGSIADEIGLEKGDYILTVNGEKIFDILQIFKYLVKKRILVFVNSLSYFSKDEIYQILEYTKLSQADVLFLEPRQIEGIQQFILDKDYILMPYNN